MYSRSAIVVGDIIAFNLKWGANGVLTDFVSSLMLNFWSTFFKYLFCVKLTLVPLWSLLISIPSTFFPSPRSFILNSKDISFNLSIVDLLLEAWAYHLHTTVDRCTLHQVAYYNTYMSRNGSCVPLASYEMSKCLYYCLGDCFNPYNDFFSLHTILSFPAVLNLIGWDM